MKLFTSARTARMMIFKVRKILFLKYFIFLTWQIVFFYNIVKSKTYIKCDFRNKVL